MIGLSYHFHLAYFDSGCLAIYNDINAIALQNAVLDGTSKVVDSICLSDIPTFVLAHILHIFH